MKSIILYFFKTYLLFVFVLALQKPVFMLFYHDLFAGAKAADFLDVVCHGLVLDLSIAGYLSIIPGLLLIGALWLSPSLIRIFRNTYFGIIAVLLAFIYTCDIVLYQYWGFRLDSTPLFYFFSSPKNAMASAEIGMIIGNIGIMIVYAIVFYMIFRLVLMRRKPLPVNKTRIKTTIVLSFATGLLFIPIRGGFSVSTMNIGKVYYSDNIKLNHAAINPCFSLMESSLHNSNFEKQYRFMDSQKADEIFDLLTDKPVTDSIPALFTGERPNIVFIILESFLSKAMETLGGLPNVAVHLDELTGEGILFTNFHANSFRTDRGLISILSGYPAQPTTSIMKYPKKTQSLPSIPHSLKAAGYDLQYYYGGDADFTNMRSFLISAGITNIVSDKDFPLSDRLSKWGAHDHIVFTRFLSDIENEKPQEPFLKIVQTLSSHEPFDVPFHRLSSPFFKFGSLYGQLFGRFYQSL